jgi:hypothetical protein
VLDARVQGNRPQQEAAVRTALDVRKQEDGILCAIIMATGLEWQINPLRPKWMPQTAPIWCMEWAMKICVASGTYSCSNFGLPTGFYDLHPDAELATDGQTSSLSDGDNEESNGDGPYSAAFEPPPSSRASSPAFATSQSVLLLDTTSPELDNDGLLAASCTADAAQHELPAERRQLNLRVPQDAPVCDRITTFFSRVSKTKAKQQRRAEAACARLKLEEERETAELEAKCILRL